MKIGVDSPVTRDYGHGMEAGGTTMKIENVLAKSISEAIAGSEELWGLVDEAISEMLSSEETEVEIWLERGHDRMAAVTVAGADDPVVVPFVVRGPFLPVDPKSADQALDAWNYVAEIRTFARELLEMADNATAEMVEMGLSCPDFAQ